MCLLSVVNNYELQTARFVLRRFSDLCIKTVGIGCVMERCRFVADSFCEAVIERCCRSFADSSARA
jgi:hypothetical protein